MITSRIKTYAPIYSLYNRNNELIGYRITLDWKHLNIKNPYSILFDNCFAFRFNTIVHEADEIYLKLSALGYNIYTDDENDIIKIIIDAMKKNHHGLDLDIGCYDKDIEGTDIGLSAKVLKFQDLYRLNYTRPLSIDSICMFIKGKGYDNVYTGELDLSKIDLSNIQSMSISFAYCTLVKKIDFGVQHTSKLRSMTQTFTSSEFQYIDISGLDISAVEDMIGLVQYNTMLREFKIGDTSSVKNFTSMFSGAFEVLSSEDSGQIIGSINLASAITTANMFKEARIYTVNFEKSYSPSLDDMSNMFDGSLIKEIDMSMVTAPNVKNIMRAFSNCSWLVKIDIRNITISDSTIIDDMFRNSNNIKKVIVNRESYSILAKEFKQLDQNRIFEIA